MLANGDRVFYKTEMPFEEFKKYISENEWIEIERYPWVSIPNGWSSRPTKASYQTKNIIYVDWNEKSEKARQDREIKLEQQRAIKNEILNYIPNWRLKWKYKWQYKRLWDEDEIHETLYDEYFLKEVLEDCKKYRCKKRG